MTPPRLTTGARVCVVIGMLLLALATVECALGSIADGAQAAFIALVWLLASRLLYRDPPE